MISVALSQGSRAGAAIHRVHLHVRVVEQPQEGAHRDPTLPEDCPRRMELNVKKQLAGG